MSQAQPLTLRSTLPLRGGGKLPVLGLGTWLAAAGGEARCAVAEALRQGYALIDTAAMYQNEAEVGSAIAQSGLPRPFVVTKLQPQEHGREAALAAAARSAAALGGAPDLYLMHSPSGGRVVETWRAMLEAKAAGTVRACGVSNFGAAQLAALAAAGLEAPEVNQVELHVFLQQRETAAYCAAQGIAVMAFCPLARCKKFGGGGELAAVAAAAGRSEAATMLRWALQRGLCVIPKSTNAARIRENAGALDFELSAGDMARLDALDEGFAVSKAQEAMQRPWEEVA
jgi:diketogulonate reductase-like aldo/keto reductase